MGFHARFPVGTPRVTAVLSNHYQVRPVQERAPAVPGEIMVSARRAPKASTFGLTSPMKLKLIILDYTFEGCLSGQPASAVDQNTKRGGGASMERYKCVSL